MFFYASCTPCSEHSYKRKRRRDAARTVREPSREGVITDQPVFFHQPFPFTTNAYWSEEIALGPGPPSRRGHRNGASRTSSQRNLASPPQPVEPEALSGALPGQKKDKDGLKNPINDVWNKLRYQREDEELWGVEIKGSSVGLSGRGRTNTADSSKYYIARNPEVNDLHPPVVSGPRSRAETRWMLQPPPSAKVMAGKVKSDTPIRQSRDVSPRNKTPAIPEERECLEDMPSSSRSLLSSTYKSHYGQSIRQRPQGPLSPIPSFQSSTYLAGPSDSRLHIDRAPNSTVTSSSRLTSNAQTLANIPLKSSPTLNSPSDSPIHQSLKTGHLKVPGPALLRKTFTTYAEDRPSTNDTIDSGKAFHPRTPSTPVWTGHAHTSTFDTYNKPYYGLRLEMNADDFSDDDLSDFEDLQNIRPYRWSMDI